MMCHHRGLKAGVLALALCLGLLPAPARASEAPPTTNGVQTVYRYLSCALGVARARDPISETMAWTYCITLLRDALNDQAGS